MTEIYMRQEVRDACAETKDWLRNQPPIDVPDKNAVYFDMNVWDNPAVIEGEPACGAIQCIGGHVTAVLKKNGYRNTASDFTHASDMENSREHALCYPYALTYSQWSAVTPAQAIVAIDEYLAGWKPEWKVICNE